MYLGTYKSICRVLFFIKPACPYLAHIKYFHLQHLSVDKSGGGYLHNAKTPAINYNNQLTCTLNLK
jgi:hypothetical protein